MWESFDENLKLVEIFNCNVCDSNLTVMQIRYCCFFFATDNLKVASLWKNVSNFILQVKFVNLSFQNYKKIKVQLKFYSIKQLVYFTFQIQQTLKKV